MSFVVISILNVIFVFLAFTFTIIAIAKNEYKLFTGLAAIVSLILTLITYININVPTPTIYPLDNEVRLYEEKTEVTIDSNDSNPLLYTYYSLNGSDPKYGSVYEDIITLSESATVCARNKFLWKWSDIAKTPYIVKTNDSADGIFVPDYRPGKEKIISNSTYQNNQGFFSKQDQMYYFATSTGIYKMNSSFEKCQLIIDDEYISYLNVLGDWIYYSSSNGIYRIRTDGKYKALIVQLAGYPLDMVIRNNTIYYIKLDDAKLYAYYLEKECESCLYDKPVCKVLCTDLYIYFVEAEVIRNNAEFSYKPTSLNKMMYNGSNVNIIFTNAYNSNGKMINQAPYELCEFEDYIVFTNQFGFFMVNQYTDEITKLNDFGGHGLCTYNGYSYYNTVKPSIYGFLLQISMNTYETVTFAKPFDDRTVYLPYIYPVENKIILMIDHGKWYYLDDNNNLVRITFDVA